MTALGTTNPPVGESDDRHDRHADQDIRLDGPAFVDAGEVERGEAAATLPIRFQAEFDRLVKLAHEYGVADDPRIRQRLEMYRHAHGRSMPLHSIARMISTMLYGKRFFPYYVYNILGGLDVPTGGTVYYRGRELTEFDDAGLGLIATLSPTKRTIEFKKPEEQH